MKDEKKQPAMTDLERINRSYTTDSQHYVPTVSETDDNESQIKRCSKDRKDSTDNRRSLLPSRE